MTSPEHSIRSEGCQQCWLSRSTGKTATSCWQHGSGGISELIGGRQHCRAEHLLDPLLGGQLAIFSASLEVGRKLLAKDNLAGEVIGVPEKVSGARLSRL